MNYYKFIILFVYHLLEGYSSLQGHARYHCNVMGQLAKFKGPKVITKKNVIELLILLTK